MKLKEKEVEVKETRTEEVLEISKSEFESIVSECGKECLRDILGKGSTKNVDDKIVKGDFIDGIVIMTITMALSKMGAKIIVKLFSREEEV